MTVAQVVDSSALLCSLQGEDTADVVGDALADRLCLATAERLDAPVLTADAAWGSDGCVRQVR